MYTWSKNLLPNKRSIQRWVQSFKDRGSLENKNKIANNQQRHSRRPNLRFQKISNGTWIRKFFKENLALNPYNIQTHQRLTADNAKDRLAMCKWFLNQIDHDETFFQNVWFSEKPILYKWLCQFLKLRFSEAPKSYRGLPERISWEGNCMGCILSPRNHRPNLLPGWWRQHRDCDISALSVYFKEVPGGSDPPKNCHLTVKKLPKTWHFFKKIWQNIFYLLGGIRNSYKYL